MITLEKLKIYKKYDGDIDRWVRSHREDERVITDADWFLIDSLIQDTVLIENSTVSADFTLVLNKKLVQNLEGEESIGFFRSIINK